VRDDRAGTDKRLCANPDTSEDDGSRSDARTVLDDRAKELPIALGLQPITECGARPIVIDEHHAVADEDFIPDLDTCANKRVALDLAAGADRRAPLNLDERADPGVVTDRTAIQVGKRVHDDPFAEADILDQAVRGAVCGSIHRGERTP
jgi:hypothetical protein